ncbi:MAG: hypothetical protein ACE5E1_05700 [Phycisphaerae bacterium]
MRPHRQFLLAATILLGGGSLGLTATYALRLRSTSYLLRVERNLTEFFELPCEVGRIRGHTFASRAFEDVTIYLPDRRDRVFSCATAIWHEHEEDGREDNRLELRDGVLMLGSDRWRRSDYRRLLHSGLEHDFEELNLSQIAMTNFSIAFDRGAFSLRCRQASGMVDMREPGEGVARLNAYELNGFHIPEGVRILARFSPKNGIEVSELILSLPEVPLAAVGIGPVVGGDITQGRFAGRVQYLAPPGADAPEIWIRGDWQDADLGELTRTLSIGPLAGTFSVSVDGARIHRSVVTHFRGRGRIAGFKFAPLSSLLKLPRLSGSASFAADQIDIALGRINRLRLIGEVCDLSLQELLRLWGRGSATGTLAVRVNNLYVVDDNIQSADIVVSAVPPADAPGTIDRSLLLGLAEKALDFTWPSAIPEKLLPEKLEYTRFGMRLLVHDNRLRVLGTHGPAGDRILTIKVFGRQFGLVHEQARTVDLGPYLKDALARLRRYDPEQVRDWWEKRGS